MDVREVTVKGERRVFKMRKLWLRRSDGIVQRNGSAFNTQCLVIIRNEHGALRSLHELAFA